MKTTEIINMRKSAHRGTSDLGWLKSFHTFSFGEYYDPAYTGFRSLRVINDDTVDPGRGFDTHRHSNMEIISYVLEGELAHKDSMGNGSVIHPGDLQRMTAGTGVLHSEFNPSAKNKTHFLQIWIVPGQKGLPPSYQELKADKIGEKNGLTLIASPNESDGVIKIHQDVRIYLGRFKTKQTTEYPIASGRGVWLHMIEGRGSLNSKELSAGDGAAIENIAKIMMTIESNTKFLLFDLL